MTDFFEFPKMGRLSRECIITEKIDGTNAQVAITPGSRVTHPQAVAHRFNEATQSDEVMLAGSRTRWITPTDDNFGFAKWVAENANDLWALGPGRHFGEWWGAGIQRKYGMAMKRWSLFNVSRWCLAGCTPQRIPMADPRIEKLQDVLPDVCSLVPTLYRGIFTTEACENALEWLRANGSVAAPGFSKPEGIVCFHTAANVGFKKTLEKDESPKSIA